MMQLSDGRHGRCRATCIPADVTDDGGENKNAAQRNQAHDNLKTSERILAKLRNGYEFTIMNSARHFTDCR